ncbi:hypothetical protein GCM10010885_05390 [Alicyclobacillus cellulosilyticus]|uniref:Uncharacterized protein n=1 Tax=Alicyclobacillus cellulosilyticus TaxID=1003997 RepID=A0A917NG73_9BACL|nr:hypothetical protein [Alicyclobacillus cellulosilyticus]GGI98824.1 hypothetical protein GCM10010885_05390 [Alicyclobacillus cellulosilyticus]
MDPLDWVHQWDDYEMVMYARADGEDPGIYMQVSQRRQVDGAEEWEVLYERKLADLYPDLPEAPGSEAWEEAQLRTHLHRRPQLVAEEKAYLAAWLAQGGVGS